MTTQSSLIVDMQRKTIQLYRDRKIPKHRKVVRKIEYIRHSASNQQNDEFNLLILTLNVTE